MEIIVAEAQAHAERVEAEAAEKLANYTNKVEAEWQSCGVLRQSLEHLQSHLADVEAMYQRKVARLEEQIATLQADNVSFRGEHLSSAAGSCCHWPTNDAGTSVAAAAAAEAAEAAMAVRLAQAEVAASPMDCAGGHPHPVPTAPRTRPSSPSPATPRISPPATPRISPPTTPNMSAARFLLVGSAAIKLSAERLRAHHERIQERYRPPATMSHRKFSGELRASTEPRRNPCEAIRALTRSGEPTVLATPPWTARNSAATRNSELSRPTSPRRQAQVGHGKPRAVERPKGTQPKR